MVLSQDTIKEGKGYGTINETTPQEQAVKEAKAKHTKQLKKGYVTAISDAQSGEVDEIIEGGVLPMLAKKYKEDKKHIKFPCAIQPKLDGMRCIYHQKGLWSRTRKPINALDYLLEALSKIDVNLVLDGELYNHDLKEEFEVIMSAARRDEASKDSLKIQYHVYDVVLDKPFSDRTKLLKELTSHPSIKIVPTKTVNNEEELLKAYEEFMDMGYEGAIIRNLDSKYENKRSNNLQKLKEFSDDEFKVVGIEEGRGKLAGHVGAFICEINDKLGKRTFNAKAEGKQEFLKECFENPSLWKGKQLTVRYQGFTTKNVVPRFPVGVRFRDKE
jgi:DNA ligase-1